MGGWTSIDEERRPDPPPPPAAHPPAAGEPRLGLGLACLALLVAGFAVASAVRHAGRARRQQEASEELQRRLASVRQAAEARLQAELDPLQARVEALAAERDALRGELEQSARMAAAREADHERALELLRLAAAPPPPTVPIPTPEPPAIAKPPEPPPAAEPPPPPKTAEPLPAAKPLPAPAPARRPFPGLPAALETRIRAEVERLRKDREERKSATDALRELRRQEPGAGEALRWFLEEEQDPRVQARLQYVLEAIELVPLWTQEVPAVGSLSRPAVADASRVVLFTGPSGLVALEASSGKALWSAPAKAALTISPVLTESLLVRAHAPTGAATWEILATRLSDGATEALPVKVGRGRTLLASDGEAFAFARDDRNVECRDGRSGRKRWEAATLPAIQTFAMGKRRVYLLEPSRRLACRSSADGKLLWTSTVEASAVVGAAGEILLACPVPGTLVGVEADTGTLRWTLDLRTRSAVDLQASSDGAAVLRAYDGLFAVDLARGEVLWRRSSGVLATVLPIAFGGFLATGEGADLVFLDARTGREVARRTVASGAVVVGVAAYRDRLYAVSSRAVAAFELR